MGSWFPFNYRDIAGWKSGSKYLSDIFKVSYRGEVSFFNRMWHWTLDNKRRGRQALWRHRRSDCSHGHGQTGIMFRACASQCWFEFLWKMGTTLNMLYKQWSSADWWHRTILEEDDGGGPRLPHGKSVPTCERNCKLNLYETDLTLKYPHTH